MLADHLIRLAGELGISPAIMVDPALLVPEQRIRALCHENKCGNYRCHYMCPPHAGSLDEINSRLSAFSHCLLMQYSQALDVRNDRDGVRRTKSDFQCMALRMEGFLKERGFRQAWGLMGGSCELCDVCRARFNEPRPYPRQARPSLESLAIDVLALLDSMGLDNKFHPDRITWTGCVLF